MKVMSCTSPKMAIIKGIDENGKKILSFKAEDIGARSYADAQRRFGPENVVLLPCGHCLSCRMAKRKNWAIRCACESKYHKESCFVTLTYDDAHLPENPSKHDFQEFIKALRNDGHVIRYFGCGEKGELTDRSHLHIILFGFMPSDAEFLGMSKSGKAMYESKYLTGLWSKGYVVVNDFDPACAGYVAGYTAKKLDKLDKNKSFILMSKRPGIGYQYLLDNENKLMDYDTIVGDFGSIKKSNIPRYFDKKLVDLGHDLSEKKNSRISKSHDAMLHTLKSHGLSSFEDTFEIDKEIKEKKLKNLKRGL